MTDWNPNNPFDLGVWEELGVTPPPPPTPGECSIKLPIPDLSAEATPGPSSAKKRKLSLSLSGKKDPKGRKEKQCTNKSEVQSQTGRFVSPKKSLESYQNGFIPKNTEINTLWAVRNFNEWMTEYNASHADDPCPQDILLTDNPSHLSFWLQKFRNTQEKRWKISSKDYLLATVWFKPLYEGEEKGLFQYL